MIKIQEKNRVKAYRLKIMLALSAGFVAGSSAFAQQSTAQTGTQDGVAGRMGNVEVRTADLRRILDAQPAQVKKQVTGAAADLDRLVRSELIRQALLNEAKAKGVDKRPDVALIMDRARDQALLQAYMNEVAKPPPGFPSDEDVKQAYDANKTALTVPPEFELAQIFLAVPENADRTALTAATKKATDLAAKAQAKGADFAKLAREQSDQKDTAAKGGELGWLPEDKIIGEIRAAISRLEKGEVTGAIRSPSGFHIVKLLDKKPGGVRPLSEVRDTIVNQMRVRRAQEIERNYIEGMVSRAQVTVNPNELTKLQAK
jgi:parvulin-like peptidyl-prolyl isomerase